MLYESPHVRVEAADGVATLWLEFPSSPVNALTPARLADLDRGLSAATASPHVEVLVVRSGRPAGFCGGQDAGLLAGLTDEAAQAAFAVAGQRTFGRLAAADVVTVAFVEGPCLGPGLELALACDYRLAVAGPDSWIGFPNAAHVLPPCWGGATRLRRLLGRRADPILAGGILTVREARAAGLFDDAFCARRAKIELRTFLDRLQRRPRKRKESGLRWDRPTVAVGFAAERAAFRKALRSPIPIVPGRVELIGTDDEAGRAVELAIRGTAVTVAAGNDSRVSRALAEAVRRGRVTPLEAEQARGRIEVEAATDDVRTAPRPARLAA
jgi:enoyl-CoA hydratase/carnithine racemase